MRLKRLRVERLPGILRPFEIVPPDAGVHVVFGPNAIGKSSICRAVEALYWPDRGPAERISLTAEFDVEGKTWRAERDGARLSWRCDDGDGERPELPASLHHRCFFLRLRDLIDPSPDGARDVAAEIRRQMFGGVDLHRISEDHFSGITGQHGRKQRRDFNAAAMKVREAEGSQSALRAREDELGDLRLQLESARSGERRLPSVRRAIGLAGRRERHGAVMAEIASLPDALQRLAGDEIERIDEQQERIDGFDERIRDLEREREDARDEARLTRLTAGIAESDLAVWRKDGEELLRVELELRNARTDLGARRKEVESALSVLEGGDGAGPPSGPDAASPPRRGGGGAEEFVPTLGKDARLLAFLRDASDHRTRKSVIEERLRLLADIAETERRDDVQGGVEELREAVDLLRRWLRAPDVQTFRHRLRAWRVRIAVVSAIAVLGAVLSAFADPRFALLLAAGAGALATLLLLAGANAASSARPRAEEAFARLAAEAPGEWRLGPVEARLRDLEAEMASVESRRKRAGVREVERRELESRLKPLGEEAAALDERRTGLAGSLGLRDARPDAELVDCVRAVFDLRDARARRDVAAARVAALETERSRLLSRLADVLLRHGEERPEDAKAAMVRLGALETRNRRFAAAASRERDATRQLKEKRLDREEAVETIGRIHAAASLEGGDEAGLAELLKELPRHRKLQKEETRLQGQISLDREELGKAGELALGNLDSAGLERLERDLSAEADRVDTLGDRIAGIEAEVREARRGTGLQDLIALREDARAELEDRRDRALFAAAGDFLVGAVEREYENSRMPRVFERARDHFFAFTRHGYRLRVGSGSGSPRLFATDLRNGEARQLDELSDGTRAQLLLAARMAFAEEVERNVVLPLFLDEALDQSDPERFDAIARSLGRIADGQGRQIFYLTSDPRDRDRIRGALGAEGCAVAGEIDLASARAVAVGVREASAVRVPTAPPGPSPPGKTPEEYGAALGVPGFAPAEGHSGQHFFYLLFDDPDLLHAFLDNGIECAGQWATVSGTPLAERLSRRSGTVRQIDARVALLEEFCDLWSRGRGRAVDRDALARSGVLSARYLDDVAGIADGLGGDPGKLLAALRAGGREDPRLSGFRKRNADALEEHLRANGCLDDRPVLDESGLSLRALAGPSANELPDGIARACLRRWWAWASAMSGSGR